MSNTLTLGSSLTALKQPLSLGISLPDFLRTKTFQAVAEVATVASLFAGIIVWALLAPTL